MSDSLQCNGLQHARSQTHVHWVGDAILCRPLLLLPSVFPSIRVFSNKSVLRIRWLKYWSFTCSISPSNEYSGLVPLGWTGWISLQPKGLSGVFSNTMVQKHEPSVAFFFFLAAPYGMPDLSSPTRDWTLASRSGSTSLNHWTSREVLNHLFLLSDNVFILFWNLVHLHSQITDEFF